ncbi:MAG: PmoA family protein [Acidobacteriota bacterium]
MTQRATRLAATAFAVSTRCVLRLVLPLGLLFFCGGSLLSQSQPVQVRHLREEKRVEVSTGGKLFTIYRYGPEFPDKPIFYPILTLTGRPVNRGFPMRDDVPSESRDHPHQKSLFFGYGNVNGVDYWSNQGGGRILHKAVLEASSGALGRLQILLEWVDPDHRAVLQEVKRVTFGATSHIRWMDHDITLTALTEPVFFNDSKEGLFAIRVAPSLKEEGGGGRYLNAFGWETAAKVWGKRAPWVALGGEIEAEEVTLALFDHPSTENYPSYWHARAYGLFAANPFGRKDFVRGTKPLNKKLAPGESFHFRYRLLIYQGRVSKERLDLDYWSYIQ